MSYKPDYLDFCKTHGFSPSDSSSKGQYDVFEAQRDLFQKEVSGNMKARRVTVSVPSDTLDELDAIAESLGLSRSGALSAILHHRFSSTQSSIASKAALNFRSSEARSRRYTSSSKADFDAALEDLILGADRG